MNALTKQQSNLLGFIRTWQENEGTSPSFDEMREALGLKSKSGVHRLILALEERGHIRRIYNRHRCIEVLPEAHLPSERTLSTIPTVALADEVRRRGLVLGEYHRVNIRVGEMQKERRRFVEIAA